MTKGVEDTAFYCYNRLIALNEVGGDPGGDGMTVEDFHAYCTTMQATCPATMTALSTHDTKRSDDVRARLAVLSEVAQEFGEAIKRWSASNERYRTEEFPDRNAEYFYYQTLIGAWPITVERVQVYMQKAMREAKQHTSWIANNKEYEDAVARFIEATFSDDAFIAGVDTFVKEIQQAGWINSLAQTLMKYTAPGVPDLYQGSELWDLSLVDPDNRRPVDYALRRKLLAEIQGLDVEAVMDRIDEGLPKLWTIHRALWLRKKHPEWFGSEAAYAELKILGAKSLHGIAYLRGENVATIVPRLNMGVGGDWEGTLVKLPPGQWRNRLTDKTVVGGDIAMADLLEDFPIALLTKEQEAVPHA
jgi:(1->4)-alpha-D-glucan 1-alpha-D-glucosylmutase